MDAGKEWQALLALFLSFLRLSQCGSTAVWMDGSGMGLTACRIGEVEARLEASGTVVWLTAGQVGSFRESVPCVSGCQRCSA